ncbi:SMI1/KNR4 family protein [Bacillus cereus group sp. BfR-BA-01380]|uniref:SMI1/KNR4 family protein n=1 Tax=Bacillus cereus group sp. BfR-BA-01380 TaxID=2920324 RepID=UPI001F587160|nr:SMI1/KNR4 family protein [Bacillus cereus group sp. BfR-BA-01380]
MNVLANMSSMYRIDVSRAPSTEEEMKALQEFSTIDIPMEYIDIIRVGSDIEINIDNEMYIRIWGASGCVELNEAYFIQKYIPNSLAIGDDEGGRTLIYFNGKNEFGLYIVDFNDLDVDETVFVAPSIHDLLTKNVGVEKILPY